MLMPVKTVTKFADIQFNADYHSYTYHGQRLTSVTTAIKQFQKPFDRDGIAGRVAAREGRTVAEILADWDAKGRAAMAKGTAVHKHIEEALLGMLAGDDPYLMFNDRPAEMAAFDNLWGNLSTVLEPHQVEWIVGDTAWGLAGTVDALLLNKDTGMLHIWDWKTGKFSYDNSFENLLAPFADFPASKLHTYSLQTSLYRLIIERNTDLKLGDSYIVHLSEDGHSHIHRAFDFRLKLKSFFE